MSEHRAILAALIAGDRAAMLVLRDFCLDQARPARAELLRLAAAGKIRMISRRWRGFWWGPDARFKRPSWLPLSPAVQFRIRGGDPGWRSLELAWAAFLAAADAEDARPA